MKIKFLSLLILSSLLFTGCASGKNNANQELFTNNKTIVEDSSTDLKTYTSKEELNNSKARVETLLNNLSFQSMEDYHSLKTEVLSYVDSSIKLSKTIYGVFTMDELINNSKISNLDQDEDGIKDIYEVFLYDTSPFRKISDERTNKDDGTKQKEIYIYQTASNQTTPIIFSDILKDNNTSGVFDIRDGLVFDLFLKANEAQSLGINLYTAESSQEYPTAFEIVGVYSPTIRGTATFYHSEYESLDTNYITYKDTKDTYLERTKGYTSTVDKLFTDTIYRLYK